MNIEQANKEREELKALMAEKYHMVGHPKLDDLFKFVWDHFGGHGIVQMDDFFGEISKLMCPVKVIDLLGSIAVQGGNLPDERLTNKTGPNDAALRGLMYTASRASAITALNLLGAPLPALVKLIPTDE